MKDKLYLKTPYKEHKDLTVPVTVIKYPVTPEDDYIVYSSLIDNTFSVKLNGLKTTPVDSEYVVDVKSKEKKLGLEPAFPTDRLVPNPQSGTSYIKAYSIGISKRLYIATAAMQGLLANEVVMMGAAKATDFSDNDRKEIIIRQSFEFAKEMLKQEQDDN